MPPNTGYEGFTIDVMRYFRRAGDDELLEYREPAHDLHPLGHGDLQAAGVDTGWADAQAGTA